MAKNKKSAYRIVAETFLNGGLKDFEVPLEELNSRRLTIDELKQYIKEEFGKVKDVEDVEAKVKPWGDAEIENEIDWIKKLNLKEFLDKKDSEDEEETEEEK